MNEQLDTSGSLFLRSIDQETKRQFKAWCAENGITMNNAIAAAMSEISRPDSELGQRVIKLAALAK